MSNEKIIEQISSIKVKTYKIHFKWTIEKHGSFPWRSENFLRSKELMFEETGVKLFILWSGSSGFKYSLVEGTLKNNMAIKVMANGGHVEADWSLYSFPKGLSGYFDIVITCTVFDEKSQQDLQGTESDFEEIESVDPDTGNQDDNDNQESQKFVQDFEKFDENNDHDNDSENVQESHENSEDLNDSEIASELQEVVDEEATQIEIQNQVQELMRQVDEAKNQQQKISAELISKYEEQLNDLLKKMALLTEVTDKNLASKDFEIASKNSEIEFKVKEIASKDDEILKLRKQLEYFENIQKQTDDKYEEQLNDLMKDMAQLKKENDKNLAEIASKDFAIASKNSEIVFKVKEIASNDDEMLKQRQLLQFFETVKRETMKETQNRLEQKDQELNRIRNEMEEFKMDINTKKQVEAHQVTWNEPVVEGKPADFPMANLSWTDNAESSPRKNSIAQFFEKLRNEIN